MKSTLFRETNVLLGYVKTLLVYTCVVIADKFYCTGRQQYFNMNMNMTSDRAGKIEWQNNDQNNLQIIWELNPILHSFVKYTPYKSQGCGCGQAAQGWEKDRKNTVRLQNWRHRNLGRPESRMLESGGLTGRLESWPGEGIVKKVFWPAAQG